MRTIRLAVVTPAASTTDAGGAERLYRALVRALNFDNVMTERVRVPSDESTFKTTLEAYLRFYELDLNVYDGVISTKGPSYMIQHRNHVSWLLHTTRVFYDMFAHECRNPGPVLLEQRDFIQGADTRTPLLPNTRRIFTIGAEVSERMQRFNGLDSTILHPPLECNCFGISQVVKAMPSPSAACTVGSDWILQSERCSTSARQWSFSSPARAKTKKFSERSRHRPSYSLSRLRAG